VCFFLNGHSTLFQFRLSVAVTEFSAIYQGYKVELRSYYSVLELYLLNRKLGIILSETSGSHGDD
jgi:hypothetical protein